MDGFEFALVDDDTAVGDDVLRSTAARHAFEDVEVDG